jgi:hypothetical protein
MRIPDLRGEEFEEAIGACAPEVATRAGACDAAIGTSWFITVSAPVV